MVRGGLSVAGCRSAWIGVLDETGEALGVLAASFPVEPGGPGGPDPAERRLAAGRGDPYRAAGLAVLGRGRADPLPRAGGDRHRRRRARRGPAGLARPADRRDDAQLRRRGHLRRRRAGADHDAGRAVRAGAGAGPAAGAVARRGAGAAAEHAAQRAARGGRAASWPPATTRRSSRSRSAATGTTWSRCPTAGSRSRSATWSAAASGGDHDGPAAQRAGRARAVRPSRRRGAGRAGAVRPAGRGRPAGHGRVRRCSTRPPAPSGTPAPATRRRWSCAPTAAPSCFER